MLIVKVISATAACAVCAVLLLSFPGFSPAVEAGTAMPGVKGDRLDLQPPSDTCQAQNWPYISRECLRRGAQATTPQRAIRIIAVDRIAAR